MSKQVEKATLTVFDGWSAHQAKREFPIEGVSYSFRDAHDRRWSFILTPHRWRVTRSGQVRKQKDDGRVMHTILMWRMGYAIVVGSMWMQDNLQPEEIRKIGQSFTEKMETDEAYAERAWDLAQGRVDNWRDGNEPN